MRCTNLRLTPIRIFSYEKSLRLSNDERAGRTTGDIVNYMSTDAQRIADITQYGTILWSGIFQMTLAFVSLYQLLGWQVRKHSSACLSLLTLAFCPSTDAYRRRRDGPVFPD